LADEAKAIEDAKRILFRNVLMEAYQQEITPETAVEKLRASSGISLTSFRQKL
jgi:hypothetical protein